MKLLLSLVFGMLVFFVACGPVDSDGTIKKADSNRVAMLLTYEQLLDAPRFEDVKQACLTPNEVFKLILHGQKLSHLPDAIGCLNTLNTLEVTDNLLNSLPDTLGGLSVLQSFYASRNLFSSFPNVLRGLPNLKRVDFSENPMKEYLGLADCSGLTDLDLSRNELEAIPSEVFELVNLEVFRASHNKFTNLPASIGKLKKLRKLNLMKNNLSSLPDSLAELQQLELLILESNNFEKEYITAWRKKLPNTKIKY